MGIQKEIANVDKTVNNLSCRTIFTMSRFFGVWLLKTLRAHVVHVKTGKTDDSGLSASSSAVWSYNT